MKQLITMIKSPTIFVNDSNSTLLYPLILHIINILLIVMLINLGLEFFNVVNWVLIGINILIFLFIIINLSFNEIPISYYINSMKQWFKLSACMNLFVILLILFTDLMYAGKGEILYGITLLSTILITAFYLNIQPFYIIMNSQNEASEKSGFLFLFIISITLSVIIALFISFLYFGLSSNPIPPSNIGGEW